MKLNLSRSEDLQLDEKTPIDVFYFLMKTSGKHIEKEKIKDKKQKIKNFLTTYENKIEKLDSYTLGEDLVKIANFVTDDQEPWSVQNLELAFKDILDFDKNIDSIDLLSVSFGSKTNLMPLNLDIVMVYKMCLKLSVKLEEEDTLETMSEKLKQNWKTRDTIMENLKFNLNYLTDFQLNIINSFVGDKGNNFELKEIASLEELSKKININYILGNSILSHEEAIIYAAKFLNYDITTSKHPIKTLKFLKEKKTPDFGDDFSNIFKKNPKYFKLDKFWKKDISFLYGAKTLATLKNYEDLESLENYSDIENWFDGIVDFEDTDEEKVLSFGKLNGTVKKYKVVDLENNFFQSECLHKRLEKLLNICIENEYTSLANRVIQLIFSNNLIKSKTFVFFKNNMKGKRIFEKLYELSELLQGKEQVEEIENMSFVESVKEILKIIEELGRENFFDLNLVKIKDGKFYKSSENYYMNLLEDLQSITTLVGKNSEYLKTKYENYKYTSYFYYYSLFGEKLFSLQSK